MELNHSLLKEAAEHGLISEQQAEQLWGFLGERGWDTPSFRFTHVLYYLGGLIAIGSMSLFMTLGWERFGGWGLFLYLCINLMMIVVGAMLSRRVFAVFGGLGAAAYLGHLAYDVFKDSMLFPFVLTIMGLVVICLGIVWQRHEEAISSRLRGLLPLPLRELIERRH
jgi:hypothetical protein